MGLAGIFTAKYCRASFAFHRNSEASSEDKAEAVLGGSLKALRAGFQMRKLWEPLLETNRRRKNAEEPPLEYQNKGVRDFKRPSWGTKTARASKAPLKSATTPAHQLQNAHQKVHQPACQLQKAPQKVQHPVCPPQNAHQKVQQPACKNSRPLRCSQQPARQS